MVLNSIYNAFRVKQRRLLDDDVTNKCTGLELPGGATRRDDTTAQSSRLVLKTF